MLRLCYAGVTRLLRREGKWGKEGGRRKEEEDGRMDEGRPGFSIH